MEWLPPAEFELMKRLQRLATGKCKSNIHADMVSGAGGFMMDLNIFSNEICLYYIHIEIS